MYQALYSDQPPPDLLISLCNHGENYVGLKGKENIKKGMNLLEQALAVCQALPPDQSRPVTAIISKRIGTLLIKLGETEKGQAYIRQAKTIKQQLKEEIPVA